MKRNNRRKDKKKTSQNSKLSLFQKPGFKFFKQCPLSGKNAPVVDYKNVRVLKKYISESGRILPSRVTSVCLNKQREVAKAVKRARKYPNARLKGPTNRYFYLCTGP